MSCSIGIAVFPEDGDDEAAVLLRAADTASDAAKHAGQGYARAAPPAPHAHGSRPAG